MRLSFEVFPPKPSDGIEHIYGCLEALSELKPEFISVTYSAGNAQKGLTAEVCGHIKNKYGLKAVSHLTCTGTTKESLKREIGTLKQNGVDTILALRGDITPEKGLTDFHHATELMEELNALGGFTLCGACYPEGHGESGSYYEDLTVLKRKYDLGVRTFISQLFFDNADFLRMKNLAKKAGIDATFCAGIMPALSVGSVIRMVSLSAAKLPKNMISLVDKYRYDNVSMRKAGLEYAVQQIRDLVKEGCDDIHLYTMDNAAVTKTICDGIKDLL